MPLAKLIYVVITLLVAVAPALAQQSTRVAFGCCMDHSERQDVFDALNLADPEVFVFLGNTVDVDAGDMALWPDGLGQGAGAGPGAAADVEHFFARLRGGAGEGGGQHVFKEPVERRLMGDPFLAGAGLPIGGLIGVGAFIWAGVWA